MLAADQARATLSTRRSGITAGRRSDSGDRTAKRKHLISDSEVLADANPDLRVPALQMTLNWLLQKDLWTPVSSIC